MGVLLGISWMKFWKEKSSVSGQALERYGIPGGPAQRGINYIKELKGACK